MRLLFTIPHYARRHASPSASARHGSEQADVRPRVAALAQCIHALHQHFGTEQVTMQLAERRTVPANLSLAGEVHVVVCTTGENHVLDLLPVSRNLFQHFPTDVLPHQLGLQCRTILRDRWGNYDYYSYLEDDLILHDPWFFAKLRWFNQCVGQTCLLLPNRFERGPGPLAHKAYVDGDLAPETTSRFQDVSDAPHLDATVMGLPLVFRRPLNPHAGCFFLNHEQLKLWVQQPHFLDADSSFIGPLESAATLGIMRTFRIYKAAREQAGFLEIEHYGDQFLRQLRRAPAP